MNEYALTLSALVLACSGFFGFVAFTLAFCKSFKEYPSMALHLIYTIFFGEAFCCATVVPALAKALADSAYALGDGAPCQAQGTLYTFGCLFALYSSSAMTYVLHQEVIQRELVSHHKGYKITAMCLLCAMALSIIPIFFGVYAPSDPAPRVNCFALTFGPSQKDANIFYTAIFDIPYLVAFATHIVMTVCVCVRAPKALNALSERANICYLVLFPLILYVCLLPHAYRDLYYWAYGQEATAYESETVTWEQFVALNAVPLVANANMVLLAVGVCILHYATKRRTSTYTSTDLLLGRSHSNSNYRSDHNETRNNKNYKKPYGTRASRENVVASNAQSGANTRRTQSKLFSGGEL